MQASDIDIYRREMRKTKSYMVIYIYIYIYIYITIGFDRLLIYFPGIGYLIYGTHEFFRISDIE